MCRQAAPLIRKRLKEVLIFVMCCLGREHLLAGKEITGFPPSPISPDFHDRLVKLKTPSLVWKSSLLALRLLILVPQQVGGGSLLLSQVVVVHCCSSRGDRRVSKDDGCHAFAYQEKYLGWELPVWFVSPRASQSASCKYHHKGIVSVQIHLDVGV